MFTTSSALIWKRSTIPTSFSSLTSLKCCRQSQSSSQYMPNFLCSLSRSVLLCSINNTRNCTFCMQTMLKLKTAYCVNVQSFTHYYSSSSHLVVGYTTFFCQQLCVYGGWQPSLEKSATWYHLDQILAIFFRNVSELTFPPFFSFLLPVVQQFYTLCIVVWQFLPKATLNNGIIMVITMLLVIGIKCAVPDREACTMHICNHLHYSWY